MAFKEFGAATSARKSSNAAFFQKLSGVGTLGAGFTKHVILELAEFFSPLFFALIYRIVHRIAFRLPNINRTQIAVLDV